MKFIIKFKLYFLAILFFTFFLLTLPYINEITIPCLKPMPATSYTDSACNLNLALDRFMLMAMGGFLLSSLIIFTWGKRKAYLPFIVTTIIFASLMIGIYLNYIKTAEKEIRNAPIILEPKK